MFLALMTAKEKLISFLKLFIFPALAFKAFKSRGNEQASKHLQHFCTDSIIFSCGREHKINTFIWFLVYFVAFGVFPLTSNGHLCLDSIVSSCCEGDSLEHNINIFVRIL